MTLVSSHWKPWCMQHSCFWNIQILKSPVKTTFLVPLTLLSCLGYGPTQQHYLATVSIFREVLAVGTVRNTYC